MIESSSLLFILYYRHRLGLGMQFLDEEVLEKYYTKNTILASDMNFSKDSSIEREIKDLLGDNGIMEMAIKEPTYHKGLLHSNPDRVYSNMDINLEICKHCKTISDHSIIIITTQRQESKQHQPTVGTKALSNDVFLKKYKGNLNLLFSKIDLAKVRENLNINKIDDLLVSTIMAYIHKTNAWNANHKKEHPERKE